MAPGLTVTAIRATRQFLCGGGRWNTGILPMLARGHLARSYGRRRAQGIRAVSSLTNRPRGQPGVPSLTLRSEALYLSDTDKSKSPCGDHP